MKKIILSLFAIVSVTAAAQQSNAVVLVDGMIASSEFIKTNKTNIKSQKVYKSGSQLANNLIAYSDLTTKGITAVELKDNYYDRMTLAKLNEQFQLPAETPVFVDGNLFKDTSSNIIGNMLVSMEVKMVDGKNMLYVSSAAK